MRFLHDGIRPCGILLLARILPNILDLTALHLRKPSVPQVSHLFEAITIGLTRRPSVTFVILLYQKSESKRRGYSIHIHLNSFLCIHCSRFDKFIVYTSINRYGFVIFKGPVGKVDSNAAHILDCVPKTIEWYRLNLSIKVVGLVLRNRYVHLIFFNLIRFCHL